MSIKTYVDELEQIHIEIKRNNTRNKLLRTRAKELESNITDYLTEKGQHGLKYKGRAIIIENKERRPAKKKKQKEIDIISLLQQLGVENPQEAYNLLQDTQKGETIEEQKIKFKKIPNLY
jgi:hypothetical protein